MRLTLEEVASGLDQPVAITHAGDGSGELYIVERTGRILVMSSDGTIAPDPLLDVSDRVDTQGERGLHYVAFHPDFASNGRFFVHYSSPDTVSYIVEYRREGEGTVARESGRTVLRLEKTYWNHNGGWLGFGPDGYLYIALGDGGGDTPGDPFGNGQKRSELFGSILRVDVDGGDPYAIPPDNPYAEQGDGNARAEIWAYGLRNPWRASFDRATGDLWIGDVGQDTSEEVDVIPAGEAGLNFGWSDVEGFDCHNRPDCDPTRYVAPLVTYGTDEQGCAVTGGYVYRGSAYPLLTGGYLFSDYCSGTIWGFDAQATMDAGEADLQRVGDTDLFIVSFGEDEAGELFVVDLGGTIQRITAAAR
ncbi:MAG: PQQ-dependent sugar dehydrogenase [Chloroflexi bacterium]|nr:PQQ-dependent sugar dehydrogenase [Chloroflexota bacterium]